MTKGQLVEFYEKSERSFWSTLSVATAHTDRYDQYATGVENRYLNVAIQRSTLREETFQQDLESIQAFYKNLNLPWVWVIREGLISSTLTTINILELLDQSTAMYCDLSAPSYAKSPNELRILENNKDLTDWGVCLAKAYQSPAETTNQYVEATKQYINTRKKQPGKGSHFHHFVGYLDTLPVSCLTLSLQENRARIDDVGTIPDQQHKGYATQMVHHALQQAKSLGAKSCFLEASQSGTRVYERLGFQELFSNQYFQVIEETL